MTNFLPALFLSVLGLASPLLAEQTMPKSMYKSTETPAYIVQSQTNGLELRQYSPRIITEVTVQGSRSSSIRDGFQVLAGFIFGGNQARAKVAMTSPVTQSPQSIAMTTPVAQTGSAGVWVVQFSMPSDYTLQNLPIPNDSRIRLVTSPGDLQAVLTFSGRADDALLAAKETDLRALAAEQGLTLGAGPFYYFYDAPFTLPWNRRNEVAFVVSP